MTQEKQQKLLYKEGFRIPDLKPGREYVFEEYSGSAKIGGAFGERVRTLANGLLNANGGVIFFGATCKGIIKGVYIWSRKSEDEYRLIVDQTIGSFLPFVPPTKYRLRFHLLETYTTKYVIELKVAAGDVGECYEDGRLNMYLVDESKLLGPLYPQEIKDLALMRYKELTDSFKLKSINTNRTSSLNKTIPIIEISDDEDTVRKESNDRAPAVSKKSAISSSCAINNTNVTNKAPEVGQKRKITASSSSSTTRQTNDGNKAPEVGQKRKITASSSSSTTSQTNDGKKAPEVGQKRKITASSSSITTSQTNDGNKEPRLKKPLQHIIYNQESAQVPQSKPTSSVFNKVKNLFKKK